MSPTVPSRTSRASAGSFVRILAVIGVCLGLGLMTAGGSHAQATGGAVHVVPIDGEIDLGLAPFLARVLAEAEEADAAAVLLEIDTPGGRLDAVLEMRDALLDTPLRTIAYVDSTAFSAGALIALSAEEIYFAPAGVMGAATPVAGGSGETAAPKVISAVSSTFRATAELRGRDPLVAEAMVDETVEIEGLTQAGSLLTLTASEAAAVGYSEGEASDRDELLAQLGLGERDVVTTSPGLAERVVRFVTQPVVASMLIALGVMLVIGELLAGAFGLAGIVGIGLLGTFFYGHLLAGLAGWEDAVLVVIGVALLLVEVLVIPGFGIAGVLGLASILGGSYLAMIGRDLDLVSASELLTTAGTLGATFLVIGIGAIALLSVLGRRRMDRDTSRGSGSRRGAPRRRGWLRWFGDGDVLEHETYHRPATPSTPETAARAGAVGVALTDLRPSGVADFDGHRIDVVTEGDYLRAGEQVRILHDEHYRRVVRRATDDDPVPS